MNKLWLVPVLFVLCFFTAACNSSKSLPYNVLIEKVAFSVTGTGSDPVPDLIIIASPNDILPPTPVVNYPAAMLETLKKVDFSKSVIVLHLVGQISDNGSIANVIRNGDTVHIVMKSYSVGPGNYELKGFTLPYQMTSISKVGEWGREFQFILEDSSGNIIAQKKHYIP